MSSRPAFSAETGATEHGWSLVRHHRTPKPSTAAPSAASATLTTAILTYINGWNNPPTHSIEQNSRRNPPESQPPNNFKREPLVTK
jgi:hypothetical protein